MNFEPAKTTSTVREALQIHLPLGLIGLGELKRFTVHADPETAPFLRLHSVDSPEIELIAVEPEGLISDYALELGDDDAEELGIRSAEDDPWILNIVTIKSLRPQKVTANLVAPIVANRRTLHARQVVLANYQHYSTTYPLIDQS